MNVQEDIRKAVEVMKMGGYTLSYRYSMGNRM